MKKLLPVLSAILTLSLLIVTSVIAEPTHPNEVGLYTTPDGLGATGTYELGTPVDVYLVMTKPTDVENNNTPYSFLHCFECLITFEPAGNMFMLSEVLPPGAINIGDNTHIGDGYLEYIMCFPSIPVIDEAVQMIAFTFMNMNPDVVEVFLGPVGPASIEGEMAFISEPETGLRVMHPISGSHDAPVFLFNGEAVTVETESFGSVKALYR